MSYPAQPIVDMLQLRLNSLSDSIEGQEWEQAAAQCESLLARLKDQADPTRCRHRWQLRGSSGDSALLYRCCKCGEESLT